MSDSEIYEVYGDVSIPPVFYLDDASLPVRSWWARKGVKGSTQRLVTAQGDVSAVVLLRHGPLGWWTRRWLRTHPLRLTVQMFRPEWGEWREQTGIVHIKY